MCRKAHSALTAPLVLQHTRIYKCAMKKFGFQLPTSEWTFFDCHLSFFAGKRRYECCAHLRICKLCNGFKKSLNFFYFQWPKEDQVHNEYLRSYLNWCHNWQVKNRRRSHPSTGSHSMGDGRIFLKTRRDASFNKDLSNEPNFDRIHLAGQYL